MAASEDGPTQYTAEELLRLTHHFALQGKWKETAAACLAFEKNYGDRKEVRRALHQVRLLRLRCHLRLEEWEAALPVFDLLEPVFRSLPSSLTGEFLLQKAFCQSALRCPEESISTLEAAQKYLAPKSATARDATMLLASSQLAGGKTGDALKTLDSIEPELDKRHWAHARFLRLEALLRLGDATAAHRLASENARLAEEPGGALTYHRLLADIGAQLLDEGHTTEAMDCLMRVETAERLAAAQERYITALEAAMEAGKVPGNAFGKLESEQAQGQITRAKKELRAFQEARDFPRSVRLRMARACTQQERYREAALLCEEMAKSHPGGETFSVDPEARHALLEASGNWAAQENWPRLLAVATALERDHGRSSLSPEMSLWKGLAQYKLGQFQEAVDTFLILENAVPGSDSGVRARFLRASAQLPLNAAQAAALFETFVKEHGSHGLAEEAGYWACTAHLQNHAAEQCLLAAERYCETHRNGEHLPFVLLRRAQALHRLRRHPDACKMLVQLLEKHPEHPVSGEAALLLGDSLLATGAWEEAVRVWCEISDNHSEAHIAGFLKALGLLKANGRMEEIFSRSLAFAKARAGSGGLAAVVGHCVSAARQLGREAEAAGAIRELLACHGNRVEVVEWEAVCETAWRLPSGKGQQSWEEFFNHLGADSLARGERVLHARSRWALGRLLRTSDPGAARDLLLDAAHYLPLAEVPQPVLVHAAEALDEVGRTAESLPLWKGLLKWHPKSSHKDRVLLALSAAEEGAGRQESALRLLQRFERETGRSPLRGRALLARAALHRQRGENLECARALEDVLSERRGPAVAKCDALLQLGELHLQEGRPKESIPYFQRVYATYGGFSSQAARAYVQSAGAFLSIGDRSSARSTCQEFLAVKPALPWREREAVEEILRKLESVK